VNRQLALECGIDRYDGLIVAELPILDDLMEEYVCDGGTGFAKNGILIDVVPEIGATMKWWRVRNAARQHRLNQVEPLWQGPAEEFTLKALGEQHRGKHLYMRSYTRGPWISLHEAESDEAIADLFANGVRLAPAVDLAPIGGPGDGVGLAPADPV
jgi:hypothetical protein